MHDDPAYEVTVTDIAGDRAIDETLLRRAIEAVLRRHQVPMARINVAILDDAGTARLNRDHLQHDGPTDVLTFDLRDRDTEDGAVDGEIVVSVDAAAREAASRGHGLDAEIALYAVHGVLHLLGFDDADEDDAARMHEMEDEVLSSIGLGAVFRAALL